MKIESKKIEILLSLFMIMMVIIIFLCGCSSSNIGGGIVNTAELSKMIHSDDDIQSRNGDEVVVHHGMVIYKDKTNAQSPLGYTENKVAPASSGIKFGPSEPFFSPKSVNIKNKKS